MHSGKLVFAQLMDHLPLHTFRRYVHRYPSKYPTKTFSHLDQFLCMAFAQLTYRESLRDIETCLRAHQAKLYHLGIRGHIAKSTLADANEARDWRIYADSCSMPRIAWVMDSSENSASVQSAWVIGLSVDVPQRAERNSTNSKTSACFSRGSASGLLISSA